MKNTFFDNKDRQKALFLFMLIAIATIIIFGALTEDFEKSANIVNHAIGSSLIVFFSYVALKLPVVILIKLAFINSYIFLLSWKYLKQTKFFQDLFTLKRKEVYYMQRKTLSYELKKNIPLCNKNISLESKIKFILNPTSILISLVNCFKEYWLCIINDVSFEILKNNKTLYIDFSHRYSSNLMKSPEISRYLKGIVVIICELILLPLKFLQPIIDLPFWFIYFIFIVAPDYFDSFLPKNNEIPQTEENISNKEQEFFIKNKLDLKKDFVKHNTMHYIKNRLENKDDDMHF